PLAALMDLQGPKLRIGTFKDGKVDLEKGQLLRLDLDPSPGDQQRVCLPHPEILAALRPGMQLLLDDGKIRLQVIDANQQSAITEVQNPAELSDRKGVNVPEALLELSPLTSKDRADLDFGLQIGVDWVALSFVHRPEDMREARNIIG
ncbi:pyruvate kinase, partial [Bacillus paranthracis]|nr:pyruvate kinase [Bacillus paranthracis]